MRTTSRFVLGLSLAITCACVSAAQDASSTPAPIPKVLQIQREFVKPGKAGLVHQKTESLFVQAMARAKWPTHYIGMTSMSGKSRALFFTSYDSLEAMEKDSAAVAKNASLSAALDHAAMVDGELLDETDSGVFVFHDEMSLRPKPDLSPMRFMELILFKVKPGKGKEWSDLVKMAVDGYRKGAPDSHWGMFEQIYGGDGGTYLLLSGHKSLSEVDKGLGYGKQFADAMGEEGMKKFEALYADCIESASQQLFSFDAHMSYVPEAWIKSDPDFWKPKAAEGKAKPAADDKAAKP
jgi:hypothetical protein